ncbi:MAG TPA: N-acetylmuramoyl-L-alanine amidase, partial [Usitatibacteraceae bacterium]|nr:N-acetylmuramoyl-L-alanine amidase [Usitatibacteraceae bacterium]
MGGTGAQGDACFRFARGRALAGRLAAGLILAFAAPAAFAAQAILASRVWPAEEYTRVTIETAKPVRHQFFAVQDPERLVLDLEGVDADEELKSLASKVRPDDPYIRQVRVAMNRPNVARVVFDLKSAVKPDVFPLAPAGEYRHRLVLDIYPEKPRDPLLALVQPGPDPIGEMARAPVMESPPDLPVVKLEPGKVAEPAPAEKAKPPPKMMRMVTIVIDAGHGGEDPGARGRGGTLEKDVTLAIARRLKERIDLEPGMRALLTRDGDYFIGLAQRVHKARRVQADLFVSVHADAFVQAHARGSSVFALSERGATSAAARLLAKRENESDLIGGVNLGVRDPVLARTLLDLSQTATINDSLKLGRAVLGELGDINSLHKSAVEQAGFAVLKAPDIPSILVETAFISNPQEEGRLKD